MKIRVFTSFSGYDSQCLALTRLAATYRDFDYELVGWSEIDKYAIQAHNALFPQWADRNYGDISKIDWSEVPNFDLLTYSSPCQDFSQAGLQRGGEKGSRTRSSLLWECERAIRDKRPKYLVMENVAALVSQKFIRLFNAWQLELESYGYRNFAKVLNAKDYGVPQNRERIFMVSVLDEQARYEFPDPMPLPLRLKDVLEPKVDERYYMSEKALEGLNRRHQGDDFCYHPDEREHSKTITTEDGAGTNLANYIKEPIVLGWSRSSNDKGEVIKRHPVQVANCVTAGKRDNTQNYVVEPRCHVVAKLDIPGKHESCCRVHGIDGIAPTQNCCEGGGLETKIMEPSYRIRKLTERECFRLMDVPEEYIDRIQAAGISRSQQYKMAGNSIVVACLYYIFDKMFTNTDIKELTLF